MKVNPLKIKHSSVFRRAKPEHIQKKYVRWCCEHGYVNPIKKHILTDGYNGWIALDSVIGNDFEWRRTTQYTDYRSRWVNNIPEQSNAIAWHKFIEEYESKLNKHKIIFEEYKSSWWVSLSNMQHHVQKKINKILGPYSNRDDYLTQGKICNLLNINRLQIKEVDSHLINIAHLSVCLSNILRRIGKGEIRLNKKEKTMPKTILKIATEQDLRDSTAYVLEQLLNGDMPVSHANAFSKLVRNIVSMNGQRIHAQIYNGVKTVKIPQLDSSSFSKSETKKIQ